MESTGLVVRRDRSGWAVSGNVALDVREVFELRRLLETAGLPRVVQWDTARLQVLTSMFEQFTTPMDDDLKSV